MADFVTCAAPAVGMIGLGLLGSALAERLHAAGVALLGWDLDPAARERIAPFGAPAAGLTAMAGCRRIVLCLPNSDVVRTVVDELVPALAAGTLLVDATTGDPDATTSLGARLATAGIRYVDATIAGSSALVRAGKALALVGGEPGDVELARDILDAIVPRSFHLGPCGSGARMKLVVNLVLGLERAVLAEGLGFAQALGVDASQALEVLMAGPTAAAVLEQKGPPMIAGDFAPVARLAQHLKDVRLILDQGEARGARLPLSELHRELLEELVAAGHGDLDNAAIALAFARRPS